MAEIRSEAERVGWDLGYQRHMKHKAFKTHTELKLPILPASCSAHIKSNLD